MAFKSVEQFNDDRYHGMFRLVDNKDNADVVFLYRGKQDELVAEAHYIKSATYSGYVHCCGENCPACKKGIRVQTKIFVPLYNLKQITVNGPQKKDTIEFWDRSIKFDLQLDNDVFSKCPNPSEYVFNISRVGAAGDINTIYNIRLAAKNTIGNYDAILAKFQVKMPDYFSTIIRDVTPEELSALLQGEPDTTELPEYTPIPRAGYQSSIPNTFVNASEAVDVPSETPSFDEEVSGSDTNEEYPNPDF